MSKIPDSPTDSVDLHPRLAGLLDELDGLGRRLARLGRLAEGLLDADDAAAEPGRRRALVGLRRLAGAYAAIDAEVRALRAELARPARPAPTL